MFDGRYKQGLRNTAQISHRQKWRTKAVLCSLSARLVSQKRDLLDDGQQMLKLRKMSRRRRRGDQRLFRKVSITNRSLKILDISYSDICLYSRSSKDP